MNPYQVFRILLKTMDEKYVDSFINDGLLFMNTVGFFRNYESSNSATRGDANEGLAASYKARDLVIKIGDHIVEGAVGKVDFRYDHEDETNVYCMTKISDGTIIDAGDDGFFLSKDFSHFGNRTVAITDIVEFKKRLNKALEALEDNIYTLRHDGAKYGLVRYIKNVDYHGPMDVFCKFDEYEWQHEWRIAFKQKNGNGPFKLEIGNLSDITSVYRTDKLISSPIKLKPIEELS